MGVVFIRRGCMRGRRWEAQVWLEKCLTEEEIDENIKYELKR